jgi:camelysin-like metallo-endopeptidase
VSVSRTAAPAQRNRARKIIGSLAIAGAAAAVAGLGTFGTFNDSTTPVATTVQTGTVDINLTQQGYTIPVTTSGFVPGDSLSRAVDLSNDGSSALSSVTLASTATAPTALTTDTTNGLQLTLKSCPGAWSQGGTASAPVYTCSGSTTSLYSGPAVMSSALPGVASLASHGVDHLLLTLSLPTAADNGFMKLSSTLNLTFTGVQRAGTAN